MDTSSTFFFQNNSFETAPTKGLNTDYPFTILVRTLLEIGLDKIKGLCEKYVVSI